jgi:hypothetical protein
MKDSPFGSYAVIENIRFNFVDEPTYWWEIKPPTAGDELALTRFMAQGTTVYTKEGMESEGSPSWLDILFYEIALLFGDTNIPEDAEKSIEDGGNPFISSDSSLAVIQERLKKLPMEMLAEIADNIAEHVPGWGPKNPLSRTGREKAEELAKAEAEVQDFR